MVSRSINTATDAFTDHWQLIAALKPALASHVDVYPQRFRGHRWFVLHNRTTGEHMRLNLAAYAVVGRLDGSRTVEEVRDLDSGTDTDMMAVGDVVQLLTRLQEFGGLRGFIALDPSQLASARRAMVYKKSVGRWKNPLAIRIPLFDPDAWLNRVTPSTPIRYKRVWAGLWLLLMAILLSLGVSHWGSLSEEVSRTLKMPHYWLLLWCVYPVLKGMHEIAHAVCLKRFGGEVHEMGITLLVFMPIPYVDASASWSLRSRHQRMLVSAAGILIELTLAAVALMIWVALEPGLLRDLAFAVFSIGSLSTVLFNANPLLRFDGYYILQDWLEIPNLHARSRQFLLHLAARTVLRIESPPRPSLMDNERIWLVVFGVAALIYRNLITAVIALWLASTLMLPGVLLALWLAVRQWCLPVVHFVRFLFTTPELSTNRSRPCLIALSLILLCGSLVAWLPVRHQTRVEGVVWVPTQSQIYAKAGGVVSQTFVEVGEFVEQGTPLLQLKQPELDTRVAVIEARRRVQEIRLAAEQAVGGSNAGALADALLALTAELQELERQQRSLVVRAPVSGVFTPDVRHRLEGKYFAQGEFIGHLVEPDHLLIHVVVPERRIGPIRAGVVSAEVRLAESFEVPVVAHLVHETPSADHQLPSAALGVSGGGGIPIASTGDGKETLEKVFHLELALPPDTKVTGVGERAYVSLQHPSIPLGSRVLTATRQLFLQHLSGDSV
ncbi:MAG: efflux RND transporter periplasmic adaptor subunit [Gammaproteobacteria bacterium]|nr:efflux RND transporter periplasmic adaptor subunit [Gammaproteobacteria bacterium]